MVVETVKINLREPSTSFFMQIDESALFYRYKPCLQCSTATVDLLPQTVINTWFQSYRTNKICSFLDVTSNLLPRISGRRECIRLRSRLRLANRRQSAAMRIPDVSRTPITFSRRRMGSHVVLDSPPRPRLHPFPIPTRPLTPAKHNAR